MNAKILEARRFFFTAASISGWFTQILRKLHEVPEEKEIQKGCDADLAPVENQREQQKRKVHADVKRSEAERDRRVEPAHQRLKRIYTERREFEHPYADPADRNAQNAHDHTPRKKASLRPFPPGKSMLRRAHGFFSA